MLVIDDGLIPLKLTPPVMAMDSFVPVMPLRGYGAIIVDEGDDLVAAVLDADIPGIAEAS
jgi:hypothetical protein